MKKFGVVDVVLAVLVVVGIAANIYVYGFYNKETSGVGSETSDKPGEATPPPETANNPANNPANDENTPAPGGTETPAPGGTDPQVPEPTGTLPEESVVNTLVFRPGNPNVTVNGREAAIDTLGSAPFFQDGAAMLPLRATYEMLGGSIEFDSNTGYVSAMFLDTLLKVKPGETGAEINGAFAVLSVAPVAINGATYVPVRSVADALGAEPVWDGEAQTITLRIPSEVLISASTLLPPA